MKTFHPVMTIGCFEPTGGAGIAADLKTYTAHHVYGMSVLVGGSIQNTKVAKSKFGIDPLLIQEQLDLVYSDIRPIAVKTGMLINRDIIKVVAETLRRESQSNVLIDPVMVSTVGSKLIEDDAIEYMLAELFPLADIVTPNLDEASAIVGRELTTVEQMVDAGKEILKYGSKSVLMKGGHLKTDVIHDVLVTRDDVRHFVHNKIHTDNTHGTGCTISSAIISNIALGFDLPTSVERASQYVTTCLLRTKGIFNGTGNGGLDHNFYMVRNV